MNIRDGLSFDDVLMVPKTSVVGSRANVDLISTVLHNQMSLFGDLILPVPILSANMKSVTETDMAIEMNRAGGLGVLHRFNSIGEQVKMAFLAQKRGMVGASFGIKDGIERVSCLMDDGFRGTLFLDIAHADSKNVFKFLHEWERTINRPMIVGNIVTSHAVDNLLYFPFVRGLKVGIGGGAACATRGRTGFGVPQLQAVLDVREAIDEYDSTITLISDGGIRDSGDMAKCFAAGADAVMSGRLFAGCPEAPHPGEYFGNASKTINGHHAPEGVHAEISLSSSVADVMKELAWGLRSAVSYAGCTSLREMRDNAEWIRCSPLTIHESGVRI